MNTRLALILLVTFTTNVEAVDGLVARWKLTKNTNESVRSTRTINHGVVVRGGAAHFNGRNAWLEIPATKELQMGEGSFTISAWIYTAPTLDDVLGDVFSHYDPQSRTGINLSLLNYAGVTSAQSNFRNVFFGIDGGQIGQWQDCGRPGTNMQIKSLVVFDGSLYAATWEPKAQVRGHVYRYAGGKKWEDCGAPDKANAITGMAVYKGRLYAGSELYSGGGSSLPLSPNLNHGGTVYRYEGGKRWSNMGKIADVRSVSGFAVFKGKLYAGTGTTGAWRDTPRHRGMYRFDGPGKWTDCGCPGLRVVHLSVHNGDLFGLSYDGGGFFKYLGGKKWQRLGPVPKSTQVYATAVYQGQIHAATWPTGSVYRFEGPKKWIHSGRLGQELEVMGMAVYNGKLYAGTLPSARIYRYDGNSKWTSTGELDKTPNVRYRRAWVTAVYQGKLFCGVLPSGKVLSLQAGNAVTYDRALAPGWHHVVAVKANSGKSGHMSLFIDGQKRAGSNVIKPLDLKVRRPLRIGFGEHDYFNGKMKDFRIYNRALQAKEVARLFKETS